MGSFGSFYKGEKKKKKKGSSEGYTGFAPVFTPPEVISKERKER